MPTRRRARPSLERELFIGNLLVRIHFIIVMIRWTGLAPWEFEFSFPGSLTSNILTINAQRRLLQAPGGVRGSGVKKLSQVITASPAPSGLHDNRSRVLSATGYESSQGVKKLSQVMVPSSSSLLLSSLELSDTKVYEP